MDRRLPLMPLARNTARIFLLVSLAYHSLMILRNGVKSLSNGLSESTPSLMATNRTPISGKRISVYIPTSK